ncbi:RNA methyltransferase [Ponticaulis sp.]|uniref:TrmH family RNA methyltransferase n=1 Tax=Ponticaulis sp. TaxID=2020902 RepID=UPI000C64F389|nr:RNA methyltransferase [Ponticaulis sp.]MAJ10641.1 RNA methyltransferase [Ponticaulis sp.]HBH90013.1 RNA methyltransferase [Hyphomonadaceae bacterium]HBJ93719.1 RNA methyltransferase [Hyphomonadaceae bacterium]
MSSAPVRITSPEDPRIADYTSVRERDLTGRDGKFIVEGKVTLDVFLSRSRFKPDSIFLETGRLPVLSLLLENLPDNIPVYTADQPVMDQIVGFPIHRGILACGRKDDAAPLSDWLKALDHSTLVVAIGLSNHDNAGALFRNSAALGGDAIILDDTSCDPLYRKSIRVSAGTALWLPFHHGATAGQIFNALDASGYTLWTLTPGVAATSLYEAERPEKLAIVLGPEGPGLPDDLIARGNAIRIPMSNEVDSLNVATSLAIVLSQRLSKTEA